MPQEFFITIDELVDLLGLERSPRSVPGAVSYDVRCPFCSDSKYHLNINTVRNAYRCNKCGENGGVLDLYGRVRHGQAHVRGTAGNGASLSKMLMGEIGAGRPVVKSKKAYGPEEKTQTLPESDSYLNKAYSALLELDYFKLSDGHRLNLLKRGLDEQTISSNAYGTMPEIDWVKNHPDYADVKTLYTRALDEERKKYSKTAKLPATAIIGGMLVAYDLDMKGVDVKRVPGFFTICGYPCFLLNTSGMIIPVRNMNREIVGLQIRRDSNEGQRYLTVSSSYLPDGVDTNVSRTHFPLSNALPDGDVKVILTEGPLKADVASHLMGCKTFFIAVPGVNNQRELPEIAQWLKDSRVSTVYSAFDMDKIIKPGVCDASKKANGKFAGAGIKVMPMLWDEKLLQDYAGRLKRLCAEKQIDWIQSKNTALAIAKNVKQLVPDFMDSDTFCNAYPLPCAKGIDDYLLKIRSD